MGPELLDGLARLSLVLLVSRPAATRTMASREADVLEDIFPESEPVGGNARVFDETVGHASQNSAQERPRQISAMD